MIINPYIYSVGAANDPDAQLFITATGISGTNATATNQLVIDLKAANIWTKMKAVYPMVGGTSTTCKFNLKDPRDLDAAYRLVFFGGGTFSANGYQCNGTNSYANTFLTPSIALSLNSASIGYYGGNNLGAVANKCAIGSALAGQLLVVEPAYPAYGCFGNVNDGSATWIANTNTSGFIFATRTLSNQKTISIRGVQTNLTENTTGRPTVPVVIGARNNGSTSIIEQYSGFQHRFDFIGDGLTDLESQLFYQITEKFQVALSRNINATQSFYYNSAYNNETNAFLFSTQITDATIQTATNTLVTDLKTAGVFTKMKALYPMVGGTATTHKFNLVNAQDSTAAFALSFVGGWTHSANGALPNGTNAYANTFLTPSNVFSTSLFPHQSFYSRTDTTRTTDILMGAYNNVGTFGNFSLYGRRDFYGYLCDYPSTILYRDVQISGTFVTSGFLNGNQSAANIKLFKNGNLIGSNTSTRINGAIISTLNTFIGATNYNGSASFYTDKECAFASIGDGLTDTEALALYNAVNAFQVSLNRQVP